MTVKVLLLLAAFGPCISVVGQETITPTRYEVVSIKPSEAQNTNKTFRATADGGFRAGN